MASKFAQYVHEHDGRFVVARWVEKEMQFQAPMTAEGRRLTGCHSVTAKTIARLVNDPNVQTYKHRSSALVRAKKTYEDTVDAEVGL